MPEEQIISDFEPASPKPPRVALIASRLTVSEYPFYMKYLLVGLADESIPATIVCPPRCDVDTIVPPAIEVIRHPAFDIPFLTSYNLRILCDRLIDFQPDILHCLCETSAALTRRLARQLDIPYLLNVNSIPAYWHPVIFSATRCAKIITPSKTIADRFAAGHPKFADRIRQINFGTFVDDSTAAFAHIEHIPGILVAHPLNHSADLQNLLNALHRLAVDGRRFAVVIVGSGRAEKHVRKQLVALNLVRNVTIIPRLPGLYAALSSTDIFIVPRPSSSFNTLLLAAMSAGCAVASCKGGVDDLVIEDQTACVFNPDDQISIYECLRRLLDAPEQARLIAAATQQHLRQNHHVSDMVGSTLTLYRQTANPQNP